jgi:uncharacterized membrane protein YbhN (UPF0104 family)
VTLTPLLAHLGCVFLIVIDVLARGLRTRACLRGAGHELPLGRVVEIDLTAEAASALSPFRLAGEPVRIAGMVYAGAPLNATVVTSATEGAVNGLAILIVGLMLVFGFAPEWWHQVGPTLLARAGSAVPLVVLILLAVVLGIWFIRRRAPTVPPGESHWRGRVREALRLWGAMPRVTLCYAVLLSVVSVSSRTLLLPLLAVAIPGHADFGVIWVGSFMMGYSQLLLPTPGGAGAVELAFLGGVAGDPGSSPAPLLVAWRAYSLGVATVLGTALALHRYGARPVLALVRDRLRSQPDQPGP